MTKTEVIEQVNEFFLDNTPDTITECLNNLGENYKYSVDLSNWDSIRMKAEEINKEYLASQSNDWKIYEVSTKARNKEEEELLKAYLSLHPDNFDVYKIVDREVINVNIIPPSLCAIVPFWYAYTFIENVYSYLDRSSLDNRTIMDQLKYIDYYYSEEFNEHSEKAEEIVMLNIEDNGMLIEIINENIEKHRLKYKFVIRCMIGGYWALSFEAADKDDNLVDFETAYKNIIKPAVYDNTAFYE